MHPFQVVLHIRAHLVQGRLLAAFDAALRGHLAQAADHSCRLPLENPQQALTHELLGFGVCSSRNNAATTCSGVRTYGSTVYTAPTTPIFFLLVFSPLLGCAAGFGSSGDRRMTIPLPSALATMISPSVAGSGSGRFSR